ncbi:hypothetical protein [Antarctobacter sp.]|uniref:hypothetical protein n=1 Tax=Antarctobacter sp. TaxID=1872577 RepID=UPI002B268BC4|nr:hypothetical protein [Antarctobacter sp.]
MSEPCVTLAGLSRSLQEARGLIQAASDTLDTAQIAVDRVAKQTLQYPIQQPVTGLPAPCDYRRQHRPGRPAKIDADAELRAFILARIDALTFPQLEDEVAKAFPEERRVRKSAINDWWLKHRKDQTAKSQPE